MSEVPVVPSSVPSAAAPGRALPPHEAVVRAHETFLRAMSDAHRAFLAAVSGQAAPSAPSAPLPLAAPAPVLLAPPAANGTNGHATPRYEEPAHVMPAPPVRAPRAEPPPAPAPRPVAPPPAVPVPPPAPAPVTAAAPAAFDPASVMEIVLETVAEKTGYPRDMLEPAMHIEGDLGIDSIKRVEILSAVQKKLPGLPAVDAKIMGGLQTLQDISDYLLTQLGGAAGEPVAAVAAEAKKKS